MIRRRLIALSLVGACFSLVSWNVYGQGWGSRRLLWEYKVESEFSLMVDEVIYGTRKTAAKADEDSKLEAALNRFGGQGWELVTVERDKGEWLVTSSNA